MADLVEVAAVKRQGRQDHRPLVHVREPGPADRRQPDARHHRQGRQGRPEPGRGRPQGARLRGRRAARRPLRRLRHRASSRRPSATAPASSRAATWTRSSSPARATRTSRTTSSATLANFFGVELTAEPPRPAGRRGDRQPADLVRQRPARPHRDAQERDRRRGPRHPHRWRPSGSLLEAARREARVSKSLFSLVQKKTVRRARPRRGHPHGRPRH